MASLTKHLVHGSSHFKKNSVKKMAERLKTALATLLVTSEGYAVKGGRKVYAGEPTTLTIDKADGAPFTVKLRVRVDEAGNGTVDVDADPWAIVRIDGVGKGKSPQRALPLWSATSARSAQIELTSPTAGKMAVSLRAN